MCGWGSGRLVVGVKLYPFGTAEPQLFGDTTHSTMSTTALEAQLAISCVSAWCCVKVEQETVKKRSVVACHEHICENISVWGGSLHVKQLICTDGAVSPTDVW